MTSNNGLSSVITSLAAMKMPKKAKYIDEDENPIPTLDSMGTQGGN